jgi:hypothetical protein
MKKIILSSTSKIFGSLCVSIRFSTTYQKINLKQIVKIQSSLYKQTVLFKTKATASVFSHEKKTNPRSKTSLLTKTKKSKCQLLFL